MEAEIVQSYGGSLRLMIVKNRKKFNKKIQRKNYEEIKRFEYESNINDVEEIIAFNQRVQKLKICLRNLIELSIDMNGEMWGFGASTKGNMLLQFLEVNENEITCILDNNEKKIGTKTIGTNIPIICEEKNLMKLPKNIIILPYYYTNNFIKLFKKIGLKDKKVISPLPLPQIIDL